MTTEVLRDLNPEQRETALFRGHCLAVSTAGSGKTKTMAAKAAMLLREKEPVAAVTFTRESALELRDRIVRTAGPGCAQRLLVGTFHSISLLMAFPNGRRTEFGTMILKGMRSPFAKTWDIVNEGIRRNYIIRALREAGLETISLEDASRMIEEIKGSVRSIDHPDGMRDVAQIYGELLDRSNQVDFQDIILRTNQAMRAGKLLPLPVNTLLVDEFQDTDEPQYEWTTHHAKAGTAVTVVGDDDQSIYAFRRALGRDGMERFVETFGAQRFMLGTNYRCRAEILAAGDRLIACNTHRIPKRLLAAKGPGGRIAWAPYPDSIVEATAAGAAAEAAFKDGASFAVIARTNRRLDEIEGELIFRKVPYRRAEGASIFSYAEVQVYWALLRSIVKQEPRDVDMVLSWAGMSEPDLKEVHRLFGNTIRVGASEDFTNANITEDGVTIWRSFAKKHKQWTGLNANEHYVLLNEGVKEWLEEHLKKPNRPKMLEVARALFDTRGESIEARLATLDNAERARKSKEPTPNEVALLTAHGSKGLEFDRVWILGAEEGVFPAEDSSLEEERRLMFVAVTRAREQLFISASAERRPSIFIAECGLDPTTAPLLAKQ